MSGARSSSVASAAAAVTISAICERAPAIRLTAVCDVPPPAGMAPKKPPATFATPTRQQLLVRQWTRLAGFRERARGGDALGEAHQSDADGGGPHLRDKVELRPDQGRKVARNVSHRFHAGVRQTQEAAGGNPHCDGDERGRRPRHEALQAEHQHEHDQASASRGRRGLGQVLNDGQDIPEEPRLLDVEPEQLRDLIHDDHQPDARFEAGQHGLGDEVGDEAEPQQRSQHQHGAHQDCQGGARDRQFRGPAIGDRLTELGRSQNGNRCRGADAERPRCAEQSVDDHRHEHRVQADLYRQARDGGKRHRLGNDHRSRYQAGGDIGAQPSLRIAAQPCQTRNESRLIGFAIHLGGLGDRGPHWAAARASSAPSPVRTIRPRLVLAPRARSRSASPPRTHWPQPPCSRLLLPGSRSAQGNRRAGGHRRGGRKCDRNAGRAGLVSRASGESPHGHLCASRNAGHGPARPHSLNRRRRSTRGSTAKSCLPARNSD